MRHGDGGVGAHRPCHRLRGAEFAFLGNGLHLGCRGRDEGADRLLAQNSLCDLPGTYLGRGGSCDRLDDDAEINDL